jgi:DNA repair protein RadC
MSTKLISKHLKYKIPQFKLALIREPEPKATSIHTPDDIEQFVEPMKHFSEEYFVAFHLDAKHHVIGYHEVSHGTISASLVHPREVFKAALLSNAHTIIVAHNHPTGELTPSDEDLQTTEQLVKVGRLLGVSVLDHIIVSFRGIKSLREHYPDLFE